MLKQNRIRSKKHLRFVASLPSCVSGVQGMTQACHIRNGCYSMGLKPSDNLVVPLTYLEHKTQHEMSEVEFWEVFGGIEKAKKLANDLYNVSGNTEAALDILARWR